MQSKEMYMANTVAVVSTADQAKKEEELERSWSDLRPELLSLILSHLFAGDHVTFRAICRSWQSVSTTVQPLPPPIDSPLSQSPCLMFLNHFFHPIYNNTYRMDIPELSDAVIRVSKYGWLLMTRGGCCVFFFNPFTKVRIQLPAIDTDYGFAVMCFSSSPTSSDCEVIGVSTVKTMTYISIIKRGEENWTTHEFSNKRHFQSSCCNPILYNGRYYCLGGEGNLLVFDPKDNHCTWTGSAKLLRRKLRASTCQSYMVESDGELFAVFVARQGRWVSVCRLNLSEMVWDAVESLGDKMLYVSHPASISETAVVRGAGNKIYFDKFHGNDGLFYSLATRSTTPSLVIILVRISTILKDLLIALGLNLYLQHVMMSLTGKK